MKQKSKLKNLSRVIHLSRISSTLAEFRKWDFDPLSQYCSLSGVAVVPSVRKSATRGAFTLAEVLITLGIIGVVAAVTLFSVRQLRYAGYAQAFLKTYSEIQQIHASVVQQYGEPQNWNFSPTGDDAGFSPDVKQIVSWYVNGFEYVKKCDNSRWESNECRSIDGKYYQKYLNGDGAGYITVYTDLTRDTPTIVLKNGCTITIGSNYTWGLPLLYFMIDVNGRFNKPNQIGRDVFFVGLEKNSLNQYVIRPFYRTYDNAIPITNTCTLQSTGMSCGYRILQEKGMKY